MNGARIRVLLLALTDIVCLGSIFIITAAVYKLFGGEYALNTYFKLWPVLPMFVLCNGLIRLYNGNFFYPGAALGQVEELRRLFFSITLLFLLMFSFLFATRNVEVYSRVVFVTSWGGTLLLLPLCRWTVRSGMKKFKIGQIRAIVAGAGYGGESLAEELLKDRHIGIVPVAFVDDDDAKLNQIIHGIPILGKIDDAVKIARERKIDYIIVCLPLHVIRDKIKALSRYFKHIMIVPDSEVFPTAWTYPIDMNGRLGVELRNQLMLRGPRLAKKLLEFVLAAVAIVCLFPLFILLAALIKITSKGPIFYSAERLGLNGKKIKVLKFRTMYNDAHTKLEQMLEANPELRKEWQEKFKLNDDPRITTLGRFLRKTSLDELPQFVNVIKGEMAVIGPRPIVEKEKKFYGENYELINRVKPGITGFWQVSGRSGTNYNQRVRMDIYYIMNWSVWLDVYILLKTVKEVLYCKGAF